MPHIYSRFCTERKNHLCQWNYERREDIFSKMAGVSHGIQPGHRGIAAARPYQSSFTVTLRHLSVSRAQLAVELCHVGQNSIGKSLNVKLSDRICAVSHILIRLWGEMSLRRCHVNMIRRGGSFSLTKRDFFNTECGLGYIVFAY